MSVGAAGVLADLAVGLPVLLGAACFALATVAMVRAGDALTRINVLSTATGVGMTLMVVAAFAHVTRATGFSFVALGEALVAVAACLVVVTLASVTLARAAYRATDHDSPHTRYDDLQD